MTETQIRELPAGDQLDSLLWPSMGVYRFSKLESEAVLLLAAAQGRGWKFVVSNNNPAPFVVNFECDRRLAWATGDSLALAITRAFAIAMLCEGGK